MVNLINLALATPYLHESLKGMVVIDYLDFLHLLNGYYVAAVFYYKLYCKSILYRVRQLVAIEILTNITHFFV